MKNSHKVYIMANPDTDHHITFNSKNDADSFKLAFPEYTKYVESELVMHINAHSFIDWNDIPKQFNFIYKDSDGVFACYYLPSKSKWFNSDYSRYKLYGGEKIKLSEKNYHHLIKIGDYFERPYGSTRHFINWKLIKGSEFIRFVNDIDENIDVFDKEGKLIYSGNNLDTKLINTSQSTRFNTFFSQTFTFAKRDGK